MSISPLTRCSLLLIGLTASSTSLGATCDYSILNEWGAGFTAEIRISNDSPQPIEGWSVSWSYSDGTTVPRTWDAALSAENPYLATNLSYNRTIAPGSFATFGFNGYKAIDGSSAQIPQLGGICSPSEPGNQAPVANISTNTTGGPTPLTVTFDGGGSTDPDGDTLSYLWEFGDGDTATEAAPTRSFDQEGNYSVSLVVNDGELDSAPAFTTITVTNDSTPASSYVLDAQSSSLYFVSTKQTHVIESHFFTDLSGSIADNGEARLSINMNSIESGIAMRNERMREFLFEIETYPEATVSVPVDLASLALQNIGSTQTENVSAILNLHGVSASVDTAVSITKLSDSTIVVQNVAPILIKAGDFNLVGGIDTLRNIASLNSISYTVPVNFTLTFNAQTTQ